MRKKNKINVVKEIVVDKINSDENRIKEQFLQKKQTVRG